MISTRPKSMSRSRESTRSCRPDDEALDSALMVMGSITLLTVGICTVRLKRMDAI